MNSVLKIIVVTLVTTLIVGCSLRDYIQLPAKSVTSTEKETSLANCSGFGDDWALFAAEGSSLSFCYLSEWGEPTIEETSLDPKSRVGTVYYVKFKGKGPGISYSTLDYAKTGDRDTPDLIDWKALDFNKNESELVSIFFEGDKVNILQKLKIGGVPMLFAQVDLWQITGDYTSLVYYFIPNVEIDNRLVNLTASGLPDQQNDLRSVLESMSFLSSSPGAANDVIDWVDYNSKSLGVSFSYPANYAVEEHDGDEYSSKATVNLYSKATYAAKQKGQNVALETVIRFSVYDNPKGLPALAWIKQNADKYNFKGEYSALQIDNREAISYSWTGLGGADIVLLSSDDKKSIYYFEINYINSLDEMRNDFRQIVETVRF